MRTQITQICALSALTLAAFTAHADKSIQERIAADPRGNVEINDLAGSVELQGWDKNEVEVTGKAGSDVDRVSVSGDPAHVSVQVITHQGKLWGSDGSAHLIVRVPAKSSVAATLVSADFSVSGLLGDLKLQSVSGDVKGEVGGDLRAGSVSGNINLKARSARSIAVRSVSGDITLAAGNGESDVTTISGTVKVEEGMQTRAHFKSVSGDVTASLGMNGETQLDGESVSGAINIRFASIPVADFDVQSVSGDIDSCFGPKPVEPRHGPGSRLAFKNGESNARVQISTKSGDVRLCTEHAQPTKPSA